MHSRWQQLQLLRAAKTLNQPLVEYLLIDVEGSSYQRVGATSLVFDGKHAGLLSGGCLEAELVLRAEEVLSLPKPQSLRFDLRDDEGIIGFGAGCDGVLHLLARVIKTEQIPDYERVLTSPFPLHILRSRSNHVFRVLHAQPAISSLADDQMLSISETMPSVTVFGAGEDALPVATQFTNLGYRVDLVDHRFQPSIAAIDSPGFYYHPESTLSSELANATAVVIMSHNLERDRLGLEAALVGSTSIIQLLGPSHRAKKLLEPLALEKSDLQRIYSPAGLKLGGRGPEAIALSIAAQVLQLVHEMNKHSQVVAYD
jgi:xanthine dehydrogenase accessory factor